MTCRILAGAGLSLLTVAGALGQPAPEPVLTPIPSCRLLDTRGLATEPVSTAPAYGPPRLRPGLPRSFQVVGRCGVPAAAVAVQLDVVATQPEGRGYLVAYPWDATGPAIWSLDFDQARPRAAKAVAVALGSGGFDLITRRSATHLVVDVVGYYLPGDLVRSAGNPRP